MNPIKLKKHMNPYRLLLCIILFSTTLLAQEKVVNRIPVYPVAYEYPTIKNTKEVLNRIRNYYESTSPQTIIDSKTGKTITDFTKFNKFAVPSNGFSSGWSYTHGVVLSAFDYITDITGDQSFFKNNTKFYDYVIENLPYFQKNSEKIKKEKIGNWSRILNFHALDDCGSISAAMIKTYLKDKNDDYLELINKTADHISNNQFRLDDGTLARHRPQEASIWADDLYMSIPFLANMGVLTGDDKYFDDAVKQILQMADRLYIPNKELFDHGWNVTSGDYDPRFYWGRANGWTLMAMAELLSVLPEKHDGRASILHLYRSMVRSLANLQDGTGFWHNLLDKNDTYLETSCTAMFTFAVAKGINEGWISHVYGPVAVTGWNAIKTRVLEDGTVDGTCEGTTFAHDNTYYYYRGKSIYATHGYGPVLYAGAEMIRLLQNDKIEVKKARINSRNSTFHFLLKSEWEDKKLNSKSTALSPSKKAIILEEYVFTKQPTRDCHASSIIELDNGDLLATWFGGTRERNPDVNLWLARKPKNGKWQAPRSINDGGGETLFNPVFAQLKGGDIQIYFLSPGIDDGRVITSKDNGYTWSKSKKLPKGFVGPLVNKPVYMDDGTIIAGSSLQENPGKRIHVERSTDNGKTWTKTKTISDPVNTKFKVIQPTILVHSQKRLQILARPNQKEKDTKIAQSWSEDGGLTWSPMTDTNLPNNNSAIDAVTLKDGRHLLVYNHATREDPIGGRKGRGILTVAISKDGINWEAAAVLEYRTGAVQYSYPAIIQTKDDLVHITYSWHRKRIKHVVIDLKKLETYPIVDGQWPKDKMPWIISKESENASVKSEVLD